MDGSLIVAALIAAPLCYLFMRWYLPRLPKRKTWREQFEEGRSTSKAKTEKVMEQARQYQELRDRAKQEKDGSV